MEGWRDGGMEGWREGGMEGGMEGWCSGRGGVATLQRCVSNQCVGEEAAKEAPLLIVSVT